MRTARDGVSQEFTFLVHFPAWQKFCCADNLAHIK